MSTDLLSLLLLQVMEDFQQWFDNQSGKLYKQLVSPVKATRAAAAKASPASIEAQVMALHVDVEPPWLQDSREGITRNWCRQEGIKEQHLLQQLTGLINVSTVLTPRCHALTLATHVAVNGVCALLCGSDAD